MANSYSEMLSQYNLLSNSLFRPIAQKGGLDTVQSMNGNEFERCLVEIMVEMAEKKGLKHKPLAIAAWRGRKDPGTKWRKIRNGTDPRGFQVQDAYDLALAMGISFVELCGMAQGRLVQADSLRHQGSEPPSKNEVSKNQKSYTHGSILPAADDTQPGTDAG